MKNQLLSGVMGLAVADALGVPVEFNSREILEANPVTSMRAYGTYNQPAGTWSDDTSMTLALVDSLREGLDYEDIMKRFSKWLYEGAYTPHGNVFDVGIATRQAIDRFNSDVPALESGGTSERDNGNGSLMRTLPVLYYIQATNKKQFLDGQSFETIHQVSKLTHAHKRSQIACGIYISLATHLLERKDLHLAIKQGVHQAIEYYHYNEHFSEELKHYKRLINIDQLPKEAIKSSGYVVHTLEAAIWCLLTTTSYEACVLRAVNLGEDTDTVAAVAGGLAGIYYGYESIPKAWLQTIAKRKYIEELCNELSNSLENMK